MTDDKGEDQYLPFGLRGERYAVPISRVKEVLTVPKITRVPRMDESVRGVINVRGSVIPVIDLGPRFGMGLTDIGADTAIVIMECAEKRKGGDTEIIGVLADCVNKVVALPEERIEPPPKIGTKEENAVIGGIAVMEDGFTAILDIDGTLASDGSAKKTDFEDTGESTAPL
jgi:purine-binding chemotaxis protein CheW